jgi:glycosyltransferase involved in cell wall biosynthesis
MLGGGEVSLKYLADFFAHNGHEVYVITRQREENTRSFSHHGLTVLYDLSDPKIPPKPGVRTVLNWAANIPQLTNMIERLKPDVVHSYSIDMLSRVQIALGERPTPSVATINNHFVTCPFIHLNPRDEICTQCNPHDLLECFRSRNIPALAPFEKLLQLLRYSFAMKYDHLTVLSEAHRRILISNGLDASKISAIPNFLDPADFRARAELYKTELAHRLNIDKDDKVVSFVGHLRTQKGVDYLIRAIPEVLQALPETKFLIVGPGPERHTLLHLSRTLGISKNVRFVPYIENEKIPGIFALSTISVFPSICSEPFGRVIIEAMTVATAVIATRVGGIPEIIEHDQNGILLPPRDSEALAKAIISLLEDKEKRISIGEQGQRTVNLKFTPEVIGPKTIEIYKSILTNTSTSLIK